MGRNLNQIIADLPQERQAKIDARYRELRDEVEGLRELRKVVGKAQTEIARALNIKQPVSNHVKLPPNYHLKLPPSGAPRRKGAMEERLVRVVSQPRESGSAEEQMLRGDLMREIVARKERGDGVKRIARELGVDRKTVKRWLRLGGWQPRRSQPRRRAIDQFSEFIARRGPEVGWNGMVLHRELAGLGFTGSYQQVQRYLKPHRAQRKWAALATVRFETGPGEQAQVDYGQLRIWLGEQLETVPLFVLRLGYSRRLFTYAYRHQARRRRDDPQGRAGRRRDQRVDQMALA